MTKLYLYLKKLKFKIDNNYFKNNFLLKIY